jgi:hypothetical protein
LVRNLTTMRCASAEGTTCSLIVITADKKQVDTQRYVITVKDILSQTTTKVICFTRESLRLTKKFCLYLNCPCKYNRNYINYPLNCYVIVYQWPSVGDKSCPRLNRQRKHTY